MHDPGNIVSRRGFVTRSATVAAGCAAMAETAAARDALTDEVAVDLPRGRVPLSFIIDDSTCLVNMGKYCMPQFAATYPDREDYKKPWRDWPDEIPDSFVRRFGSWCAEHGVKGKYSIVPYPACVGWMDRTLPGWSQQELRDSLALVRDLMLPNWDIHPEMISHTRVIDLKTGRPFEDYSPAHMENSYPQQDVSVDYLASYLAYALKILKNCDLPCEGITTPGGFGNRVKEKLPLAVFDAVRDVYGCELPHYFKYIASGEESTEPTLEPRNADALGGQAQPEVVSNVPAGTGDWFGGWDGVLKSLGQRYSNNDATSGRMVELIEQRRPAVMLCHWPGMYCGGSEEGYRDFQRVVLALAKRFGDQTQWMKVSEIARYWTAKEMTKITRQPAAIELEAPFAAPQFTLRIKGSFESVSLAHGDRVERLEPVSTLASLLPGRYFIDGEQTWACFDLPKGNAKLRVA